MQRVREKVEFNEYISNRN